VEPTLDPPIVERSAVRAIVITPEHEVLLSRIRLPGRDDSFWITPGGGLELGEDTERGLRRELVEELGLERFDLGPLVWLRQHTFSFEGRRIRQHERYHVVHVPRFMPRMTDPIEARVLQEFRWWPLAELPNAREPLTPRNLAGIILDYLAHGAPTAPLEIELAPDTD